MCHAIWHSVSHLLAPEVGQCPLKSTALRWGTAVPTEIWSSRLRPGSAHCDPELAVEVQTDERKERWREEATLIKPRDCLETLSWQVGNDKSMFTLVQQNNYINLPTFVIMFWKTTCLSGSCRQQALCGYPNGQLVLSRRQLKVCHPSRRGHATSCEQLGWGTFWKPGVVDHRVSIRARDSPTQLLHGFHILPASPNTAPTWPQQRLT